MAQIRLAPRDLLAHAGADIAVIAAWFGVDVGWLEAVRVRLAWDRCSVTEAVDTAAALATSGAVDEALAVAASVLDQVVGCGARAQTARPRRPVSTATVPSSNRPPDA